MVPSTVKDPQVFISNKARILFDNMKRLSDFQKFDNKDFFILAMLFGYHKKKKKPLKKTDRTQSGYARERYFSSEDMEFIKAISISETEDLRVVENVPKMFSIAEEYVNGGFEPLKEFIYDNPADFIKKMANELKKC